MRGCITSLETNSERDKFLNLRIFIFIRNLFKGQSLDLPADHHTDKPQVLLSSLALTKLLPPYNVHVTPIKNSFKCRRK